MQVAAPVLPDSQRETAPQPTPPGLGGTPGPSPIPAPSVPPSASAPQPPAPHPAAPAAPHPAPHPAPAPPTGRTGSTDRSDAATQYIDVRKLGKRSISGVLVAIDGDLEGQVFTIAPGENKLGRDGSCDVVLDSMKISREHATIVHEASDNVFAIMPLNDKNPVLVNEEPVDGSELSDGDLVTLGRTAFRFRTIEGL